jgi:hypothetical protein
MTGKHASLYTCLPVGIVHEWPPSFLGYEHLSLTFGPADLPSVFPLLTGHFNAGVTTLHAREQRHLAFHKVSASW